MMNINKSILFTEVLGWKFNLQKEKARRMIELYIFMSFCKSYVHSKTKVSFKI